MSIMRNHWQAVLRITNSSATDDNSNIPQQMKGQTYSNIGIDSTTGTKPPRVREPDTYSGTY